MPRRKPAAPPQPRIGRPPTRGSLASERLELRVTPEELARWTESAGDLPVSRWVIEQANRAAKRS